MKAELSYSRLLLFCMAWRLLAPLPCLFFIFEFILEYIFFSELFFCPSTSITSYYYLVYFIFLFFLLRLRALEKKKMRRRTAALGFDPRPLRHFERWVVVLDQEWERRSIDATAILPTERGAGKTRKQEILNRRTGHGRLEFANLSSDSVRHIPLSDPACPWR